MITRPMDNVQPPPSHLFRGMPATLPHLERNTWPKEFDNRDGEGFDTPNCSYTQTWMGYYGESVSLFFFIARGVVKRTRLTEQVPEQTLHREQEGYRSQGNL